MSEAEVALYSHNVQDVEEVAEVVTQQPGVDPSVRVHVEGGPQGDRNGVVDIGYRHKCHPSKEHLTWYNYTAEIELSKVNTVVYRKGCIFVP